LVGGFFFKNYLINLGDKMLQPLLQQQRIANLEQQVKQLLEQQKRMLEHITELTDIVVNLESTDE
tara:strand:- start:51 stop:245 length:195 start_codon:yes stop_codon:yes gene_type:complete